MLLSSILQILSEFNTQTAVPKPEEKGAKAFDDEMIAAMARESSGEPAQSTTPSDPESKKSCEAESPANSVPPPGPSLEGLLQMVTKLKEDDQSRVVDVFE